MLKCTTPLAFAALILVGMQAKIEENKTTDKNALALTGDYLIVSGEKYGQKEPDDRIVGTLVHFTDDRIFVEDRDHKSTPYIADYTLDTSKTPCVITMTKLLEPNKGETVRGLVERDGDQLRLIYALPGGDMPKEFKTKDKQLMFVMKPMPR